MRYNDGKELSSLVWVLLLLFVRSFRRVLKITFAVFSLLAEQVLLNPWKEHSELCFLKEKAKDARQKQKDNEGQYKEQRLNLCGGFLEHAFTQKVGIKGLHNTFFIVPLRKQ